MSTDPAGHRETHRIFRGIGHAIAVSLMLFWVPIIALLYVILYR